MAFLPKAFLPETLADFPTCKTPESVVQRFARIYEGLTVASNTELDHLGRLFKLQRQERLVWPEINVPEGSPPSPDYACERQLESDADFRARLQAAVQHAEIMTVPPVTTIGYEIKVPLTVEERKDEALIREVRAWVKERWGGR